MHHPIRLDQEQFLAGLLALAGVSVSVSVRVSFIGKLVQRDRRIPPETEVFFRWLPYVDPVC